MPKPEVQRFYEADCRQEGRLYRFRFRADNFREASDHAKHCCRVQHYDFVKVRFLDYIPPSGMGLFISVSE